MKNLHKYVLATLVVALMSFLFSSCTITEESLTPEQRQEYVDLKKRAAAATTDAEREAIERDLHAFEQRILNERAGPVVAFVKGIFPAAAPVVEVGQYFLGSLILPLFTRRGRGLAKKGIDSLNPLSTAGPSTEVKAMNVRDALRCFASYFFGMHSSAEGEKAMQADLMARGLVKGEAATTGTPA